MANNEFCYLSSSAPCSRVRRPPEGGEHGQRLETLLLTQILHRTPENHLVLQVSDREQDCTLQTHVQLLALEGEGCPN